MLVLTLKPYGGIYIRPRKFNEIYLRFMRWEGDVAICTMTSKEQNTTKAVEISEEISVIAPEIFVKSQACKRFGTRLRLSIEAPRDQIIIREKFYDE